MHKPFYQRVITSYLPWILLSVTFVASLVDTIKNLEWITPLVTYIGTLLILGLAIIIGIILQKKSVHWITELGEKVTIKFPGIKTIFVTIGLIISLWIPRFLPDNPPPPPLQPVTIIPPAITVIVPNGGVALGTTPFSPTIEEFELPDNYRQTNQNIFLDRGRVVWNFSRDGGDQFIYRKIPAISSNTDIRFTVVGQIDSWTNNCRAGAGIGDAPGTGIAIYFGFYGGGCQQSGTNITAGGVNVHFREDSCDFLGQWPWINGSVPYRATLEIEGASATLLVEDVAKVFATKDYTGEYTTLWVGNTGRGDWPTCSGTVESVTIEPYDH